LEVESGPGGVIRGVESGPGGVKRGVKRGVKSG